MFESMENHSKRNEASAALIALRKAMDKTQQTFAVEVLDCAIGSVARWETSEPPRGDLLLRLASIAEREGLQNLRSDFLLLYARDTKQKIGLDLVLRPPTETDPARGMVMMEFEGVPELRIVERFLRGLAKVRKVTKK
jgi:transcriptional regulator with XRE-family HTH domain